MKLYYSLLASFAAAAAQELRGGHQRSTAVAYPECDARHPSEEQLSTHFGNGQAAYDYCIGECQNSKEFCINWDLGCDDPMPSQASLTYYYKDAQEAFDICYYECDNRSEEFCMNWKNNYAESNGSPTSSPVDIPAVAYPECDARHPLEEQLSTHFGNGQAAYDYCIGECQNSKEFCTNWDLGCDDPMPSQASLAYYYKDAQEAYDICYYECDNRSEEFCMNWKNNYPTESTESDRYPECDDPLPSQEQLSTHFESAEEAYGYCVGECQNSGEFCMNWKNNYPTPGPVRNGETKVYIISETNANFCGHDVHQASKCGGHLASITTAEEYDMVEALVAKHGKGGTDLWIGGKQIDQSNEPAGGWAWSDGETAFDSSYWSPGQPDNMQIRGKGQHHVMRKGNGLWKDENGCAGFRAPRAPGIYILPVDYNDKSKYPDCDTSNFLA